MEPVIISWSGGKDAALALHRIQLARKLTPMALLTTATREFNRSSMHGIRLELIGAQAAAAGLPLEIVWIEQGCDNHSYETAMRHTLERYRAQGVRKVVFGDLFLEDIRAYREKNLASVSMEGVFPLWGEDTGLLIREIMGAGLRAVVSCVDTRVLHASLCGQEITVDFIVDLPEKCDPCGENGEYHTFVWSGPIFDRPIAWERGETVLRDNRFQFCDFLPVSSPEKDSFE